MDKLAFTVDFPPFTNSTNAGLDWVNMKQRLAEHLHLHSKTDDDSQFHFQSFLFNLASVHVQDVFRKVGLTDEEAMKFDQILNEMEDVCLPRFLITYSRYKLSTCTQAAAKVNYFLQRLLTWSESCEYEDLKDIILLDRFISGLSDESLQQNLRCCSHLDFKQSLERCNNLLIRDMFTQTQTQPCPALVVDASKDYLDVSKTLKGEDFKTSNYLENTYLPKKFTDYNLKAEIIQYSGKVLNVSYDQDQSEKVESDLTQGNIILENVTAATKESSNNHSVEKDSFKKWKNDLSKSVFVNQQKSPIQDQHCECGMCVSSSSLLKHRCQASKQNLATSPKFSCITCKKSFYDDINFKEHEKSHLKVKKYSCDLCRSSFGNPYHLKIHLRMHSGERPFTCDTCGASFLEASKLKAHARKHTGERPYVCNICKHTFTWTSSYKRHVRTHSGEKPYVCEFCRSSFADLTSLQRHRRSHTKDKPYACDTCGLKFIDQSALKSHRRTHTGERPYSCQKCTSSFSRSQHLKEHMKRHSGKKPFECETCGSKFVEASKLKVHQRKHTGEKPYICKICGSSFAWTAAYTRHMRTHTLEKPYLCLVCDSRFADHSTLTRHQRRHTKERPYTCKVCQTNFVDNSSLLRHVRIHTGEKLYICEVCGMSFAIKSYLMRHMRVHTGEKPYHCTTCGAKFTDSSKLKRHTNIHMRTISNHNETQLTLQNKASITEQQ